MTVEVKKEKKEETSYILARLIFQADKPSEAAANTLTNTTPPTPPSETSYAKTITGLPERAGESLCAIAMIHKWLCPTPVCSPQAPVPGD